MVSVPEWFRPRSPEEERRELAELELLARLLLARSIALLGPDPPRPPLATS